MNRFLEQLELRTNRAFWADGLLDLLCGACLMVLGVSWVTGHAAFGGIVPALLVPLWKPLRQRFTDPRLGVVELGEGRQGRNRAFIVLMLVAGTLSFLLGIGVFFAHGRDFELSVLVVKALPGLIVAVGGIATAAALQLRRFYAYSAVTAVAAVIVAVTPELNPGWAFLAGGVPTLLGGVFLFASFARRHPVRNGEASS